MRINFSKIKDAAIYQSPLLGLRKVRTSSIEYVIFLMSITTRNPIRRRCFLVGQGLSINVWNDPWILCLQESSSNFPYTRKCDLIGERSPLFFVKSIYWADKQHRFNNSHTIFWKSLWQSIFHKRLKMLMLLVIPKSRISEKIGREEDTRGHGIHVVEKQNWGSFVFKLWCYSPKKKWKNDLVRLVWFRSILGQR